MSMPQGDGWRHIRVRCVAVLLAVVFGFAFLFLWLGARLGFAATGYQAIQGDETGAKKPAVHHGLGRATESGGVSHLLDQY
jgi:hypothetical protein